MALPTNVPDACTLPTVERPARIAEWDRLFVDLSSTEQVDPIRGRLVVRADAELQERLLDLAARESSCCSFFHFAPADPGDESDGVLTLEITVPPVHSAVLSSFLAWAEDVRTGRREPTS